MKSHWPRTLAVIVAGVLVGAVIGATVVYLALAPPAPAPLSIPVASFGMSTPMPFGTRTHLASMSRNLPIGDYSLRLRTDGAWSQAATIPGNMTDGGYALVNLQDSYFAIFYRDAAPQGILDVQDQFLIAPMHGSTCPADRTYLDLMWNATYAITNDGLLDWSCSLDSSFTLGSPAPMGNMANGTAVSVTSATDDVLPMNLMTRLSVNSSLSSPGWVAMGNGTSMTLPGSMVTLMVGWDDRDGSGTVNAGDGFFVTSNMRMGSGVHITLYILNRDGSPAGSTSWTT